VSWTFPRPRFGEVGVRVVSVDLKHEGFSWHAPVHRDLAGEIRIARHGCPPSSPSLPGTRGRWISGQVITVHHRRASSHCRSLPGGDALGFVEFGEKIHLPGTSARRRGRWHGFPTLRLSLGYGHGGRRFRGNEGRRTRSSVAVSSVRREASGSASAALARSVPDCAQKAALGCAAVDREVPHGPARSVP